MPELSCINLSASHTENSPFPHLCYSSVLASGIDHQLYEWFESTNEWSLTEADFYTQYEFLLSKARLPEHLQCMVTTNTIETIQTALKTAFGVKSLETVSIVAHKLVNGHKISVHNDYINGEETHRLVIQINPHWTEANGGFLMLFRSPRAEDFQKLFSLLIILPSALKSQISLIMLSQQYNFSRYSIVYTFKER